MNLPVRLDQGLEGPTPTLVRQVRGLLERRQMPCGYPGCSFCDPVPFEFFCTWDD